MKTNLAIHLLINNEGRLVAYGDYVIGVKPLPRLENITILRPVDGLTWKAYTGPPRPISKEWMQSEDGQEFQEEMKEFVDNHEITTCSVCGQPMDADDGHDVCYNCRHGVTY